MPTIKRCFKCQRTRDGKFALYYHSSCRLLRAIISESGVSEGNIFIQFWAYERKEPCRSLGHLSAIEEGVHLAAMSMNVKKEGSSFFIGRYLLFEPIDLWMKSFTRKLPLPIDIITWYIASIVATDDSIHIHHRYYLYLVLLSKIFCFKVITTYKVNKSFNNKRRWTLSRMLSGNDVYDRLDLSLRAERWDC